jgi:hypothetical protein
MDAYISKPINSKELFELVEGVARDRTAQIPQPIKTCATRKIKFLPASF